MDTMQTQSGRMKMDTITTRLIAAGALFVLTLLSGLWLSHLGKPYNSGIFSIHKLIALATIVIIGMSVYNLYKGLDLQAFISVIVIALTGMIFLGLIVTGALLSLNIPLGGTALKIHQIAPLLALISSAITIYMLTSGKS